MRRAVRGTMRGSNIDQCVNCETKTNTNTRKAENVTRNSKLLVVRAFTDQRSYRWDVFAGELVGCIRDQKTGFTDGTIANHNTLDGLHASMYVFCELQERRIRNANRKTR
jgi:hypothetical protein